MVAREQLVEEEGAAKSEELVAHRRRALQRAHSLRCEDCAELVRLPPITCAGIAFVHVPVIILACTPMPSIPLVDVPDGICSILRTAAGGASQQERQGAGEMGREAKVATEGQSVATHEVLIRFTA